MRESDGSAKHLSDEQRLYLRQLEYRALKAGDAHHRSARLFDFVDTWVLGTPSLVAAFAATILTTITLTQSPPAFGVRLAAVLCAALSAALTGVRNQVGASGRAVGHQRAGVAYNALRRKTAAAAASTVGDAQLIDGLNTLYDEAGQSAPVIPRSQWNKADTWTADAKPHPQ
ncbi:hypothetical protein GCM10011594_44120 [Nakamurella endophytica]|uniref:SLATT domain-containing protein n=1 Tax=Nakamurella endophytica TaxID=1748367 RepID=A0A917WPN7_9ACTN|nr:hypothetical protein GCM10011594_44120 [Nakamurella endophytica]